MLTQIALHLADCVLQIAREVAKHRLNADHPTIMALDGLPRDVATPIDAARVAIADIPTSNTGLEHIVLSMRDVSSYATEIHTLSMKGNDLGRCPEFLLTSVNTVVTEAFAE